MYMGDTRYGLQKTTDGGLNWEVKNQGITAMTTSVIAAPQGDLKRVYATFKGWPGVFRSGDSAANWQFVPVENAFNTNWIRLDPFDSQTIYLAADSGFYTSVDEGLTWTPSPGVSGFGGFVTAFQVDPHQTGHFLVGACSGCPVSTGELYEARILARHGKQ
jgi:Fe-S cluster biogenesis protein NfuA